MLIFREYIIVTSTFNGHQLSDASVAPLCNIPRGRLVSNIYDRKLKGTKSDGISFILSLIPVCHLVGKLLRLNMYKDTDVILLKQYSFSVT
jgi:hypothetical protein